MKLKQYFFLFILSSPFLVSAQKDNDLVQFSGMVITADSLKALPYVSIRILNTNKGTYSDQGGFFSFVVRKGDTVEFSFIGNKTIQQIIPKDLNTYRYSVIMPMSEDTLYLPETVIRGWPTLEEFNYYFVKATIPDGGMTNARYNIKRSTTGNWQAGLGADANLNTSYYFRQQAGTYYSNGQLPPQRLFDPFAWNEFFKSWKRGDYKKK